MKQFVLVSPEIDKHERRILAIMRADKTHFVIVRPLLRQYFSGDLFSRGEQFRPPVKQFSMAKSYNTFGPTGPLLVTSDEFPDRDDIALDGWVDGLHTQTARSSDLIFSVPRQIAWLSRPDFRTIERLLSDFAGSKELVLPFALLVLAGIAAACLADNWRPLNPAAIALPWLVVPPFLLIGGSYVKPVYVERYVEFCLPALAILVAAGLIEDATKLWWDLRPSARFPTLEMRITDSCATLEDSLSIAALFRCLLRMLWRLKRENQRWRLYARMLIDENRWRAQRYGFDQGLVDFGKGAIVPYAALLEEILALIDQDARHFGCVDEVLHAREILARGTSAHRQLGVFDRALSQGATRHDALAAVVDWLIEETAFGL